MRTLLSVLLAGAMCALLPACDPLPREDDPAESAGGAGGDDGTHGDEGAADDDGAPEDARCYVVEVEGQAGCWDSAEEACQAACGDPACECTEATVNNTCGCPAP